MMIQKGDMNLLLEKLLTGKCLPQLLKYFYSEISLLSVSGIHRIVLPVLGSNNPSYMLLGCPVSYLIPGINTARKP